jgi:hypothetical protein
MDRIRKESYLSFEVETLLKELGVEKGLTIKDGHKLYSYLTNIEIKVLS